MKPYKVSSEKNVTSMRHKEFYNASRAHYFNWVESKKSAPKVSSIEDLKKHNVQLLSNNQTLQKASRWGLIVFSAFTLEAFINFYAEINKMPDRREKERKYGTKKKWRSYPNLVAGKNLDDEIHKQIESIFNLRDKLVHFKPITGQNNITSIFNLYNGGAILNKVHNVVRSLDGSTAAFHSSTWIGKDFTNAQD